MYCSTDQNSALVSQRRRNAKQAGGVGPIRRQEDRFLAARI